MRKDIHTYNIYNTPPWMSIMKEYASLKSYYGKKNHRKKNRGEGKRAHYSFVEYAMKYCHIKILSEKSSGIKLWWRKKSAVHIYSPSLWHHLRSLSRHIPVLYTNFSNVAVESALVNKSARLSLERICWTSISPLFWRSWVKKNFGEIYFILSLLMCPPFNWAMHAALSSCNVVGMSFLEDIPHFSRICWIMNLNQIHFRLASWIAKISTWLKVAAAIVYFVEHQKIAVPPRVNK